MAKDGRSISCPGTLSIILADIICNSSKTKPNPLALPMPKYMASSNYSYTWCMVLGRYERLNFGINSADEISVGVGAVHHDKDGHSRVIAYASRALTDVESRYSQIEREALAVTWRCLHFHLYIYGRPFTIVTDHKPLVSILGNPNSKPPLRIERWALKLQQYE